MGREFTCKLNTRYCSQWKLHFDPVLDIIPISPLVFFRVGPYQLVQAAHMLGHEPEFKNGGKNSVLNAVGLNNRFKLQLVLTYQKVRLLESEPPTATSSPDRGEICTLKIINTKITYQNIHY